jgi:hypothetical protein
MARPRNVEQTFRLNTVIRKSVWGLLMRELMKRHNCIWPLPQGAFSKFLDELLVDYFKKEGK